jgi:hypothetical protein
MYILTWRRRISKHWRWRKGERRISKNMRRRRKEDRPSRRRYFPSTWNYGTIPDERSIDIYGTASIDIYGTMAQWGM